MNSNLKKKNKNLEIQYLKLENGKYWWLAHLETKDVLHIPVATHLVCFQTKLDYYAAMLPLGSPKLLF
jgi:hypothetical protein